MAGLERNVAGQSLMVFAFDVVTGAAKTGDAANITLYRSIDEGTVTQVSGPPTELSAANMPGAYRFTLSQADTNGQYIDFLAKSSTISPNIVGVVVMPTAFTVPAGFSTGSILTNSGIADAVWDEARSGHTTGGTFGENVNIPAATELQIDAIETDTSSLNDTKITTARANSLDNLDAAVSSRSTVSASTALPASPTPDTVGDAWKRASVGIPLSAAGESGGLATYNNVNAGVIFGTVNDTTPGAGDFIGDAALEDTTDDYYTGRFLIFTSNDLGARKVSSYTASTRTFEFTGTPGTDADAPFDAAPPNGSAFIIFGFHGA